MIWDKSNTFHIQYVNITFITDGALYAEKFTALLAFTMNFTFEETIVWNYMSEPDTNFCEIQRAYHALLYPSPNIIRIMKSRRMRWAGHVA
jgi:hypothetical protein